VRQGSAPRRSKIAHVAEVAYSVNHESIKYSDIAILLGVLLYFDNLLTISCPLMRDGWCTGTLKRKVRPLTWALEAAF
jgi:hypothetical protein